jgi:aspartyl-tRNA(Asn)/glutamyl-tRNA(Gln) amidotransferase subunit B
MPAERRATLLERCGELSETQRDALDIVVDLSLDEYLVAALDAQLDAGVALSRLANEVAGGLEGRERLTTAAFCETISREISGALSATQSKTVLGDLLREGGSVDAVVGARGFTQLASDTLSTTIAELIEANPSEWQRYLEGDDKLAQFFIGLVMKATKGQANGKAVIAELAARRG